MPRRPSLVSLARARSEVSGRTASRDVLLRALEIAAEIADDTDQPVTGRTRAIIEVRALSKHLDEIDSHRVLLEDEWHKRRPRAV